MTRRLRTLLLMVAVASSADAAGLSAPVPTEVRGGVEERLVSLGGRLVAALAPALPSSDLELLLLVRPVEEPDGPRRLLELRGGSSPTLTMLSDQIDGGAKVLAALDRGEGPELLAGGLGRIVSLGRLGAAVEGERELLLHPGVDLRSLAPRRLRVGVDRQVAAAEVGALRIWQPRPDGALGEPALLRLPFSAQRDRGGLVLRGLPVVALPEDAGGRRRFAAGPEVIGTRLRVMLATQADDGAWKLEETWSSLPGAESVEESWIGLVDGAPGLIVHTQGAVEIDAFEDQRWRAFRLVGDVTRAGHGPGLAVTVDSKRWHDDDARFADVDGDGHDDVVIARPEGMSGSDLVVEVHRGQGAGSFERRARRSDVDDAPSSFALLADVDGHGRPGLVGVYDHERRLVVWRLARNGRHALETPPLLRATWEEPPASAAPAPEGPSRWTSYEWLGAVPRREAPPDLLILAVPEKGSSSLLIVRPLVL